MPPFCLVAIAMPDAGGRGRLKNAATVFQTACCNSACECDFPTIRRPHLNA
ncbi:hypothetical protein [Neisseria elongata]